MNSIYLLIVVLCIRRRTCESNSVPNIHHPCEPNPCRAGTCELLSQSNFTCHCIPYVHGRLCEQLNYAQHACESHPCYNQGLCSPILPRDSPTNNTFMCLCSPKHAGDDCQENVGECACVNGGSCYNTSNHGYQCSCPSMFNGSFCQYDFHNRTFCSYSPCQNNATCIVIDSPMGICLCQPGYTGEFCDKRVPFCEENPCQNNGTCVPLSSIDGQCLCQVGYSGRLCEHLQRTFCSLDLCRNGSTCIVSNHTGDGFCLCSSEYVGPYCEYITPTACQERCEQNQGQCTLIDNKYSRCLCPKDVTGVYCDIPLHPCVVNPCENNGICVHDTTRRTYQCLCTYGYSGLNCSENLNQSFCSSNPCRNNGSCLQSPLIADGLCQCDEGYSGEFCQEILQCGEQQQCQYPEQICFVDRCVNVTGEFYCLLHECQHGGRCDSTKRQCQCLQGFAGLKCELKTRLLCNQTNQIC